MIVVHYGVYYLYNAVIRPQMKVLTALPNIFWLPQTSFISIPLQMSYINVNFLSRICPSGAKGLFTNTCEGGGGPDVNEKVCKYFFRGSSRP